MLISPEKRELIEDKIFKCLVNNFIKLIFCVFALDSCIFADVLSYGYIDFSQIVQIFEVAI